jgi:Transposase.
MKRSRFSEEQIIGILREVQGGGNTRAVCAAYNISEGTYYAWKRKYGGMDVSEARRLRALEDENARLKRIIADLSVQNHILKEVNSKKMVSPSAKRRAAQRSSGERRGEQIGCLPCAGSGQIRAVSPSKVERGGPAHPQGGAGTQRQASSLRLSAHHGAVAA